MALTQQFTAGQFPTAAQLNQSSIPVVSATADITTPFTGQLIFNTADNKIYRYTGAAWTAVTSANTPNIGSIAAPTMLLSGTGLTTSDVIQGETLTGTVVSGLTYRITHSRNEANSGVANIRTSRYRVASGATVTAASTLISSSNGALVGSYVTASVVTFWTATFSGQATFGVSSFVNTSTGLIDAARNREYAVECIG